MSGFALRPPARPGAFAAGVLFVGAALTAATALGQGRPAPRELTAADAMSLGTPAVANRLGLSEKQRRRVREVIREHAAEFARLHERYPRGAQDNEGEDLRRKALDAFGRLMPRTTRRLLDVLNPSQRDALRRLPPADLPGKGPPEVVEPFPSVPPFFAKLGLTQRQWRALDGLGTPTAGLPSVGRRPTPEQRRNLAGLIRHRFEERDRAARKVLTEEQELILDSLLAARGKLRAPRFRVLDALWPERDGFASLRLARLPGLGLRLESEGCFARLVRKGAPARDPLVHPADYLVTGHAFSPGGKFLATVASTFPRRPRGPRDRPESLLRVWEVSTGRLLAEFPSENEITDFAFVDDSVLVLHSSPMNGR
jgi:hypothetical protein